MRRLLMLGWLYVIVLGTLAIAFGVIVLNDVAVYLDLQKRLRKERGI